MKWVRRKFKDTRSRHRGNLVIQRAYATLSTRGIDMPSKNWAKAS